MTLNPSNSTPPIFRRGNSETHSGAATVTHRHRSLYGLTPRRFSRLWRACSNRGTAERGRQASMSVALRRHNDFARLKDWWRRYFWSRHEFWAKHTVHRAAIQARSAISNGSGRYHFWHRVCVLAAQHCARHYGPVPGLLLRRPIGRDPLSLSSPEVSAWLRVEPPFREKARLRR
jgi:hypothetical protein